MIFSTRSLPERYVKTAEVNLVTSKGLLIILNIIGSVLALVILGLLMALVVKLNPGEFSLQGTFEIDGVSLFQLVAYLLGLTVINTVLHEGVHGFFFWYFTGSRPLFALKLTYAYAAAPEWFIPRRQYMVVGLAPLVLLDAAALVLIWLAPAGWAVAAALVAALNTGGAVGDMWVVMRLLACPADCLVQDKGDGISFFEPV